MSKNHRRSVHDQTGVDTIAILANREYHRPTIIASQSNPDYWARTLPDRVAADSIVNRLASNARKIHLGDTDMRKRTHQTTKTNPDYWE
jgi:DNA replication protein DnaC